MATVVANGVVRQTAPPAPKKSSRILPTDRITFTKQLDLLRAWAAASGPSNKVASNEDVASIVKMVATTVSMANSFFADAGFLQRTDGGFLPSPEVVSFNRAHEWNPETAAYKLAPVVERSWFAQALMPRLGFNAMVEKEAIVVLAEAAVASPEKESQLSFLLEYMQASGLIANDNGTIRRVRIGTPATSPDNDQPTTANRAPAAAENDPSSSKGSSVATTFASPTEGVVQFHVSVRVDMGEFADWEPDRIKAFFGGRKE